MTEPVRGGCFVVGHRRRRRRDVIWALPVVGVADGSGVDEDEGVSARVLDCYSLKPLDAEAVRAAARDCGVLVTVEDHWPEGGLGDAVLDALADAPDRPPVTKLAVREMPGSGSPEELLREAGIDAEAIAAAARKVVRAAA